MKKLFKKDEVLFAVLWIILYVVSFSLADGLSEAAGIPKAVTVCVGAILSGALAHFVQRNRLWSYLGLQKPKKQDRMLGYVPLIAITLLPLLCGVQAPDSALAAILGVISMCFVSFLEEVIFRGLLFRAMSRSDLKTAVIISSVTFGAGHVVNLLMGAPVFDTMLQLVYASAVGFCYTAVAIVGGSIWPCILSHAIVNCISVFAVEMSVQMKITIAVAQTVLGIGYGVWLLCRKGERIT